MADPAILDADRPLVLLPVRLETRFFGAELRVRVFPDKIHVDTHEPELTADELVWGRHFHTQAWTATTDDVRKEAWRQLADRYGTERAMWVARQLTPTNPTERPAKPPKFPQVPTRPEAQKDETWMRAPHTRVLPDHWIATAFFEGRSPVTVTGQAIPDPLPVGPNPLATPAADRDDVLAIDAGMAWMVDFDAAERVGMGLRVPLPAASTGDVVVSRLIVFGVKRALDSAASAARLRELLEAHAHTDGLGLILPGTPTNNTPAAQSGFSTDDAGHERSFRLVMGAPAFVSGDGASGDALHRALGVPADVFTRAANAGERPDTEARHMNRALWSATWGYYLEQMMLGPVSPGLPDGVFTPSTVDAHVDWARQHFVEHVRAGGPLAAMRVGKQPYGVLPVTALDLWGPAPADGPHGAKDADVVAFVRRLQDYWSVESRRAPRIGQRANPDVDFAEVFSVDGLSSAYAVRNIFGLFYARELAWFLSGNFVTVEWLRAQAAMADSALANIGGIRSKLPRAALSVCDPASDRVPLPLVQAAPDATLTFNYIDALLKAPTLDAVLTHASMARPFSLLYLLLRHAFLLEYAGAAARALGRAPLDRLEPEHPRFPGFANETPLDRIVAAALHTGPAFTQPTDVHVQELRKSVESLKTLSPDRLSSLMRGTLDLTSYRLDAWVTSFASKRLKTMRAANPTGVYLGGYGWVENIRPGPARTVVPSPPGEDTPSTTGSTAPGPITTVANDPGFVHAPSLAHAATVAVLRSGHMTQADQATKDLLAIDLSSKRARTAQYLLDGVRAGQPVGALLGYRLERRLHEKSAPGLNLHQFIAPLRRLAPIVSTRVDQDGQAVEAVPATHVTDGLTLHRRWKAEGIAFLRQAPELSGIGVTFPPRPDHSALTGELDALGDDIDAVSDALVAESVHQVVSGNPSRAAATLDALERGEAPPPELEVIRTPRSGSAFTHRVVTLLPAAPAAVAEWAASPRAQAEPALTAWAAKLLGSPSRVRCVVDRVDATTGTRIDSREIRLQVLRLGALDVIYAQESAEDSRLSELEQRVIYQVRRTTQLASNQTLRFNPVRDPSWPPSDLSWSEFMEVVRAARSLLTSGRALRPSDLTPGDAVATDAVDTTNLQQRATRALTSLRAARAKLQTAIDGAPTATSLDALRSAMHAMATFGIPGAIPLSPVGATDDVRRTLDLQARSIDREAGERVTRAEAATDPLQRMRDVFGPIFVALPRFRPTNATDIQKALAASTQVQGGDAMAVVTFHQRMARVREAVARLDDALQYAEALATGDRLTLQVAQLPHVEGDRWIGLPAEGRPHPSGRLSIVAHLPEAVDLALPIAGLLIDEWIEVVPSANETTGVVFQYNQPDAVAPQAILVAVHPNPVEQGFWTVPWLRQVLTETIALVQMRAVTPDLLEETSHYLPAAYVAMNVEGHTVTTDFFDAGQ